MAIYIIIAILITIAVLYAPKLNDRSKKAVYVSLGIVLILIIVARDYTINRDYIVYERLYNNAPDISLLKKSISEYNKEIVAEFSYSAFCTLFKATGNTKEVNLFFIFAFYAIIGVSLKMYAITKLTKLHFLSLLIYFSNSFLLHEMTQIRAGVALGFVLLSVYKLQKEEYFQYLILIFIGSFFHSSALMALVLVLFRTTNINAKVWASVFFACLIIHLTHFDILKVIDFIPFEYYQFKLKGYIYLQNKDNIHLNYFNVVYLLQNAIIIICFYYKEQIQKEEKNLNLFLNMCCLSSCSYLFFGQIPGFAVRISEVFNCSLIILIPLIVKAIKPKHIAEALVLAIGWGIFLINILHSKLVLDYKTLW